MLFENVEKQLRLQQPGMDATETERTGRVGVCVR